MIEDTESTIDLAAHGWTLHNYPERLAYSATPPDFGSLCIQRHRWANGGLLILPKLWRAVRERRTGAANGPSIGELLLRLNYMALDLLELALRALPDDDPVQRAPGLAAHLRGRRPRTSWRWPSTCTYCGYKRLDAARIYGFNLLLLPVNLAGSLSSIVQALTGAKGKFLRTPEGPQPHRAGLRLRRPALPARRLLGRTRSRSPASTTSGRTPSSRRSTPCSAPTRSSPSSGVRNSLVDIWVNVVSWLYKPQKYTPRPARSAATAAATAGDDIGDWAFVLYMGFADRRRGPRFTPDLSEPDRTSLVLPVSAPPADGEEIAADAAPLAAKARD